MTSKMSWYAVWWKMDARCRECRAVTRSATVQGNDVRPLCEKCWFKPDRTEPGACPRAYAAARQLVKAGLIRPDLPMGPDELLDVLARQLEAFTVNREAMPNSPAEAYEQSNG